jgi:serine acetyltransferase
MPGFTIKGKINRHHFKLGGNDLLPGNGMPMIGDNVYITSNVRLIKNKNYLQQHL